MRRRVPGRASPRLVSFVLNGDIWSLSNSTPCRASIDNIRLWNVAEVGEFDKKVRSGVQFKIIAGHHGGFISQMRAYGFGPCVACFLTLVPSRRPRSPFSHNRMWEPRMARGINADDLCTRDKVHLLRFIVASLFRPGSHLANHTGPR